MEQRPRFPDVLQYLEQEICAVKAQFQGQVGVDKDGEAQQDLC